MRITPNQKLMTSHTKGNANGYQPSLNSKPAQDSVAFKGLNAGSVKGGFANVMDWIERKGFIAEFLIIDTISMIIPRIVVGLGRDKEKTGKTNYKAAAEEAGREITSGPGMMAIPLALFWGLQKAIPSAKVPEATMQDFSGAMQKVTFKTETQEIFKNKQVITKEFADELFEKAFGDKSKFEFAEGNNFKAEFTEKLTAEMTKDKKANASLAEDFEQLIIKINNQNTKAITQDTKGISVGGGTTAKNLFDDFKKYSDDIVTKFVKKDFAKNAIETGKEQAKTFLQNIQKSRSLIRIGASAASFAAVGSFLLYLPKLTQVSKISPAEASAKLAMESAAKGVTNENK